MSERISVPPYRYVNPGPQRARHPIQVTDLVAAAAPAPEPAAALHGDAVGLLALARRVGPCSVTGLATAAELPEAVALALVADLEHAGLVRIDPAGTRLAGGRAERGAA
ncbi:hypothetical protein HDA32_005172 [Spinactinospora alkalitolerans]|uniref:DprA winged helix domain-containing protein n=1 Tax=Spinactinospora alkalitolerans TaxID=687207 RepID=A0A852U3K0_9ACTN|nr:DUF742 domain-containing protein [Spinactinospora alkalitolerans]NYE50052.1 hypothetical protein [Spinactinospora alkalitolerans]